MKRFTLIAAVTALAASPVMANEATEIVNRSADNASELVSAETMGMSISTGSMNSVGLAYMILNSDADNASQLRGTNGATLISGTPTYGSSIFMDIDASDDM